MAGRDAALAGGLRVRGAKLHRLCASGAPVDVPEARRLSRVLRVLRRGEGVLPAAAGCGAVHGVSARRPRRARAGARRAEPLPVSPIRRPQRLPEFSVQRSVLACVLGAAGPIRALFPHAGGLEDCRSVGLGLDYARAGTRAAARARPAPSGVTEDPENLAGPAARSGTIFMSVRMTIRGRAGQSIAALPPAVRWRVRNAVAVARWLRMSVAFSTEPVDSYSDAFWNDYQEGDWRGLAAIVLRYCAPRSLVDVGCGDGKLLAGVHALDAGLEILGVDGSHAAVR